jgi:hypothetical protein
MAMNEKVVMVSNDYDHIDGRNAYQSDMAAVMFLNKSFYQHGFTSTAMVSNSSETK